MNEHRVCLLGDSHTARWGPDCSELRAALRTQFGRTEFRIENHGGDPARVGTALWRASNDYWDGHAMRRCATAFDPTLTIVESFAYSHGADGPEGMGEYRDLLRRLVDEMRQSSGTQVIFCVTLPPHRERFGENSALYAHASRATRQRFAYDVRFYLDEARRIAQDEEWPLADVAAGVEKRLAQGLAPRRLTDQSDGVHPSPFGYHLQASVIVRAIDFHRMVEEASSH